MVQIYLFICYGVIPSNLLKRCLNNSRKKLKKFQGMLCGRLYVFKNISLQVKCCSDISQTRTEIRPFKTVSGRLRVLKDLCCEIFH